jgi:dipeptidyl aminopeptidase/acylaminoacyl peptidase
MSSGNCARDLLVALIAITAAGCSDSIAPIVSVKPPKAIAYIASLPFSLGHPPRNQLVIQSLDGSTDTIPHIKPDQDFEWAEFSPDGMQVAVSTYAAESLAFTSPTDISVIYLDGTAPVRQLTSAMRGEAYLYPTWSPRQDQIAYLHTNDRSGAGSSPQYDLWVMDSGGRSKEELASDVGNVPPHWSPDGRWILFGYTQTWMGPAGRRWSAPMEKPRGLCRYLSLLSTRRTPVCFAWSERTGLLTRPCRYSWSTTCSERTYTISRWMERTFSAWSTTQDILHMRPGPEMARALPSSISIISQQPLTSCSTMRAARRSECRSTMC